LKYSDDYESIDVAKLVEELENYGIFENNTYTNQNVLNTNRKEENFEEFSAALTSCLKTKNMKINEFFKDKIGVSEEGEMLILLEDFQHICFENSITKNRTLAKNILKEICKDNENNYVSISKLSKFDIIIADNKNEHSKNTTKEHIIVQDQNVASKPVKTSESKAKEKEKKQYNELIK